MVEADGVVPGLDGVTGARRWADPLLRGCRAGNPPENGGLSPAAALVLGSLAATVVFECSGRQQLARLDPLTGRVLWRRTLPPGWTVQYQSPSASSAGVIGVLVSGLGTTAFATVKLGPSLGPHGYESDTLIAVDAATGDPLWQVDDVPESAVLVGGAGQLCVVSGFATACYVSRPGAVTWHRAPPVVPSNVGAAGPEFTTAATDGNTLFLTVPTTAAGRIPLGSTVYRALSGTSAPGTNPLSASNWLPRRATRSPSSGRSATNGAFGLTSSITPWQII